MSDLLPSNLIKRLNRFSFSSKDFVRAGHKGEHRSSRNGTSLEFSDFRIYHPGDDLRLIDWNTYARTNKYYVKRFLDEKELSVSVILDATLSMFISEEKWKLAQTISASLSLLALSNNDKFRITAIPNSDKFSHAYLKGKQNIKKVFKDISEISRAADNSKSFAQSLTQTVKTASINQGMCIVVSDFLEPIEPLLESLKLLHASKQQILLFQILLPEEKSPTYSGDLKLVDIENKRSKDVTMSSYVLNMYDQKFTEHQKGIQDFSSKRGIGFISCSTDEPVERIIFKKLAASGIMKVR